MDVRGRRAEAVPEALALSLGVDSRSWLLRPSDSPKGTHQLTDDKQRNRTYGQFRHAAGSDAQKRSNPAINLSLIAPGNAEKMTQIEPHGAKVAYVHVGCCPSQTCQCRQQW